MGCGLHVRRRQTIAYMSTRNAKTVKLLAWTIRPNQRPLAYVHLLVPAAPPSDEMLPPTRLITLG